MTFWNLMEQLLLTCKQTWALKVRYISRGNPMADILSNEMAA